MTVSSFFSPVRMLSVAEAAQMTGARLTDPRSAEIMIRALSSLEDAGEGDLVFAAGRKQIEVVAGLKAAAIFCAEEVAEHVPAGIAILVTKAPQRAFAHVGRALYPDAASPPAVTGERGISAAAFVHPSARIEEGAAVEHGAVVGAEVEIGSGTVIAPHAVVGRGCRIGRNCFIGAQTVIQNALIGDFVVIHGGAQIGQDGFGYVPGRNGPEKIPQLGRVVLQNGVEIGAATTVDRGALGDTVIGENTKIDNLVQVAHNVRIGRNCVIASHTGISGSVTIGDNAMLGGRVGVADHITIGSNVQLAAATGVTTDVPSGVIWGGFPAQPFREWLRGVSTLRKLAAARGGKGRDD